jgi:hypothetical protein
VAKSAIQGPVMSEMTSHSESTISWDLFEDLQGILSGPREFEALLRKFFDLTQLDIQEIKAAFLKGEFNRLERIAHRMISSSHPIGAIEMIAILRNVENLALRASTHALRDQIKLLDQCFQRTKILIEQRLQKSNQLADSSKGTS